MAEVAGGAKGAKDGAVGGSKLREEACVNDFGRFVHTGDVQCKRVHKGTLNSPATMTSLPVIVDNDRLSSHTPFAFLRLFLLPLQQLALLLLLFLGFLSISIFLHRVVVYRYTAFFRYSNIIHFKFSLSEFLLNECNYSLTLDDILTFIQADLLPIDLRYLFKLFFPVTSLLYISFAYLSRYKRFPLFLLLISFLLPSSPFLSLLAFRRIFFFRKSVHTRALMTHTNSHASLNNHRH